MGNQGSQLGDEPAAAIAQKNLQHFDHSFKGELHTTSGPLVLDRFGECTFAKRPVSVVCKGGIIEITEDVGISSRKQAELKYAELSGTAWDHANSEVKLTFTINTVENFVILTMANSIEFEGELKLRLSSLAATHRGMKVPMPMYIGMFAGANKPKPFQRKRPNLSHLPSGKLPTLHDMRSSALDLHRGSYKPCAQGASRRQEIALQHIYEGCNTFPLLNVRGASSISNQYRSDSQLVLTDDCLALHNGGSGGYQNKVDFPYSEITDWKAIDNDNYRLHDSGIEIVSSVTGDSVFFGVSHVRDVKHTLEFFWNKYQIGSGAGEKGIKLGSTHGRPIVSVHTLSGEMPPPDAPVGQSEVVDQDGILVRPGARIAPRRSSMGSGVAGVMGGSREAKVVPSENKLVKAHWHKVVMHQGWLMKQGGVGVGTSKAWIKRYFVLYATSQGHFLVYYSDFTECPMYSSEKHHRNIVDLAKATFIRPGSKKSELGGEVPPHSFDIVTTEREWTLCAESQENVQKWLRLITRAVDEDVAILPDEELVFQVKPKCDPLATLPVTDYSTALKVSANGVSVCVPDPAGSNIPERELYFWVYTDFYKWSLLSQAGKLALLLNVFADSSFSRRNEYIFRNKEAVRLATAIEYFIEKFMSVMHIRLETTEGAFDAAAGAEGQGGAAAVAEATLYGEGAAEMVQADAMLYDEAIAAEVDLLSLDGSASSPTAAQTRASTATAGGSTASPFGSSDPFGVDPFGEAPSATAAAAPTVTLSPPNVPPPKPPSAAASDSLLDLLSQPAPTSTPLSVTAAPIPASATSGADPFGSDPFGGDPFGSDPFGGGAAPAAPAVVKTAPPFNEQQLAQHRQWQQNAIINSEGPFYYDGSALQITVKIETRGSQCRLTFLYRNQSPAQLSQVAVTVHDPAGLLRYDLKPFPATIEGLAQNQHVMMIECMKPASPGPSITFAYKDTFLGMRKQTVDLPILMTSFNTPLPMPGDQFSSRWAQLTAPGQEATILLRPAGAVNPMQIQGALYSILKFGRVTGIPNASDSVLYGAATLHTGSMGPSGSKISVGCLARIEIDVKTNTVKATFRTVHPAASAALVETAKSLIK